MSEDSDPAAEWQRMVENMNEAVATSVEQNMEASAAFMESWTDAMADSVPDDEALASGMEGYTDAYEVWMDAAEQTFERTTDAAQGEDVAPGEFRDLWLQSANEAFKEVMSTEAFAAANGQLMGSMLDLQEQTRDMSEDALADVGLATRSDVEEVGKRLVELERRQHRVEEKLDRVIEALQ